MRFGNDGKKNSTMSGIRLGKLALTALLLTTFTVMTPLAAYAERDEQQNSWWQRQKAKRDNASSSSSALPATTTNNFAGSAKGGKAVTKTEIFADGKVAPMVSTSSSGAMANAISRYQDITENGGWGTVPSKALKKGDDGDAVVALKRRLIAEGYLAADALTGDTAVWYTAAVENAVSQYQTNNGLAVSGSLDKSTIAALNVSVAKRLATMRANVPRLAEYSKDLGPRYITVNVPALQLEAVSNGKVFSRHNVIAGSTNWPTPVTMSQVTDINFNPYWNVPVSIVDRDILPRVRRSGTSVFREMNLRVFDGWKGPEVNPRNVNWNSVAADQYFFRQDPGESNSMASVKINFLSPFGIYLHDTPTKNLFAGGARYLSSGCVRVEQVSVLVNWILNGQDGWSPGRIEEVKSSLERIDVKLQNPPQVRTIYLTAWVNGAGQVNFRPDVYDLDGSGFIVGQPLAVGERSDDGKRYVLNNPVYEVEDRSDRSFSFFGQRRKNKDERVSTRDPFDFFNTRRSRGKSEGFSFGSPDTKSKKKSLADIDDDDGYNGSVFNFNRSGPANVKKKKTYFDLKKKKTDGVKKKEAAGKKKPAATADAKKKKVEQTASAQKKPQPTPAATVVKKKKKVEEASATAAPPGPEFGQPKP